MTAVVSEAKAKRTKQSLIAQAELNRKKVKMIAKLIFIVQFPRCIARKQNSSVTKREETTRSHPEHGRKDSLQ